jgi:hypothetical protein
MRAGPFVSGRDRKGKKPGVNSGEKNGHRPIHYRTNLSRTRVALSLAKFVATPLTGNVCKLTW